MYLFLPPATKLGQGNIFRSVCQEFCSQGGVLSQQALQQVSKGVVSQHAMQVSRPTPRGGELREIWPGGRVSRPTPKREVEGDLARWGGLQAHTRGEVEGDLAGGSSGPHPRGKLRGIWLGGLQAHTQGGS